MGSLVSARQDCPVAGCTRHLVSLTPHRCNISLPGISYLFCFIALEVPITWYSVLISALSGVDSSVFEVLKEPVTDTLSFTVTGLDGALDIPGRTISVVGFASDVSCKSIEDGVGFKELFLWLEEEVDDESVVAVSLEEELDDESVIGVSLEEELDTESVIVDVFPEVLEDDDGKVTVWSDELEAMVEDVVNDDNETGVSALLSQSVPEKPELNKLTLISHLCRMYFPTLINWTSLFRIVWLLG